MRSLAELSMLRSTESILQSSRDRLAFQCRLCKRRFSMATAVPTRSTCITYQVEPFDTSFEEAQELLIEHWEEIALNKDKIKLAVDVTRYKELADRGALHIVTVRDASIQKSA